MFRSLGCSYVGCRVNSLKILRFFDNGWTKISLCPLHLSYLNMDSKLQKGPSEINPPVQRELCNSKIGLTKYTIIDQNRQIQMDLCKTHLRSLLIHTLSPKDYKHLKDRYGVFADINIEFYHK